MSIFENFYFQTLIGIHLAKVLSALMNADKLRLFVLFFVTLDNYFCVSSIDVTFSLNGDLLVFFSVAQYVMHFV